MKKAVAVLFGLLMFNAAAFAGGSELFLSLEKDGSSSGFAARSEVAAKDVENKNTPAAFDLVSSVPGVFVSKAASVIKSDISIRGLGDSARKLGVFIDGRPEKMSIFGCGVAQSILSGNVDSIEIIKGPDSVLYGSDALGGVINIVTKMPQKPFEASLDASYGSFNTQNYFLSAGGRQDKFSYYGSANKASSDGYIKSSGYNAMDYGAKFSYRPDAESELSVGGKYFDGKEYEPSARRPNGAPVQPSWYDYKRGGADLRYKRSFENIKADILLFGDFGEHLFSDAFHSKDSTLGAFARFSSNFFDDKNTLKYGAQYKYSDGKIIGGGFPYRLGEWDKNEFAVFALDEHAFNSQTKAFAGVRYNHDEISGDFFAPRAGLSYSFTDKFSAKAVYSRGFRSPQLNELYTLQSSNP
ncbi:MAG: TonB-dependent receptor, partial [Endomicrobia bacterium]|nr:TonB-dependent receptor [Endomicrobiia bacterium]